MNYIPKVGDSVAADRKVRVPHLHNRVIGSVVEVDNNSCRIATNPNTRIRGDFNLPFDEWKFHFLHLTSEVSGQ